MPNEAYGSQKISVLNPVGFPPKITPKSMAPRLDSLDGKTLYLVDPRFDDSGLFLRQVKGWFADHMPSVTTKLVEMSSVYTKDDPKTWEMIKANGDGAIIGVGHWSTCAPAVAVHAITLDSKYGVPTMALHTHVFKNVVKSVTQMHGMPQARYAFVPQPVMGKTAEQLRDYVDGKDPLSGRPVMQEVIEGLTRPAEGDRVEEIKFERSTPRLADAATEDDLHRLFLENNWTDKLPIVLPTEERVAEMLARTSHKPEEVSGHLRSNQFRQHWEFTVEKVAVNAVMAGARPEYFPVILALASSGVSARGSTTSSMAAMVVVNGPIRHEIGMNAGTGAMAPYNHANATIGRAYGLLSQNLQGGSLPGDSYMGSQGNNYAYNSMTFAENEEASPWEPFHVQHGFKATDSTVSIFTGCRSTAFTLGVREKYWREHMRNMLRGMDAHSAPTFVLDPIAAKQFIDRGRFDTKEKLIQWVYENALMPAGEYWDYQLIQNYIYPRATFGEEPYASKLKAAPDELIPMFKPDEIHAVVVGGETNGYWRIIGCNYQKTVSVDEWRWWQLLEVNIPHDKDHVPTDLWMRAELPGIDAAGDVRQDSKVQAITSTGEGAVAAIAPYRHIKETFD